MIKSYSTLIFDAFDTIVHIDRSKLPACLIDGQTIHTTVTAVQRVYEDAFEKIDLDVLFRAFSQSFVETEQLRRTHFREISSQDRFREMLRLLGHNLDRVESEIVDSLTMAHMDQLQEALEVRPDTMAFLEWASTRFRRAMISNFDYAPALYKALERFGVRSAFERIMVSVEVGWRKPHPFIFERTLEELRISAADALFIGDQLYLDVFGSIQSGMDVVWLDAGREQWTSEFPKPTHRVESIREIIPLLEVAS